ncbi:MAG: GntR family transcriptional regulator [Alcaligenes sp.]
MDACMKNEFNSLHVTLAHRLLDYVRAGHLQAGHHLTEQSLAQALGASRSPVRGALAYLAEKGVVGPQPPRRGLFLLKGADELGVVEQELGASQDDEAYLQLARDKLSCAASWRARPTKAGWSSARARAGPFCP